MFCTNCGTKIDDKAKKKEETEEERQERQSKEEIGKIMQFKRIEGDKGNADSCYKA